MDANKHDAPYVAILISQNWK